MSRVHRFYTGPDLKLKSDFWIHDEALLWQWNKVLRFRDGQKVILFDGDKTDRLYQVVELKKTEAHLKMITELERKLPDKHIYLMWSLLKKDNNDHVLQKCTELGVTNFVPVISERSIRKDFNIERARKIVIEACEQSGRSDIPHVREPVHLEKVLDEYKDKVQLLVAHQESAESATEADLRIGLLIGPEGGWSSDEEQRFKELNVGHINLNQFTLRAETASVAAVAQLL